MDLTLEVISPATPLPSAVGNAAYRILQESITNVIRHAGPTLVTVALNSGTDFLEIRVTDNGRRSKSRDESADRPSGKGVDTRAEPGRGILGMRERCRLLGGEFDAKPTPDGGFEVMAQLPLAPTGSNL
ncbi:sensor histidine kinase [Actinomadura coerulea]|uniref:sensor histidine kinase n=1 Tax=Actinomadura coerulea TaxID=46159 RepID=UPI003445AAB9